VPLEVRERRARQLIERLAEAIARAGIGGDVGDTEFLAPEVAARVRGLADMYRELGTVTESEWGDEGHVVARFPDDRTAPVELAVTVDDRSVVRAPGCALAAAQRWRLLLRTDGLCRRIEALHIEAAP
jgi:hypothetical protein